MSSYVLEGPKWSSNTVSWSFETSTYTNNAALPFSTPIMSPYQDTVRQAFARWASVSGLNFNEVPDAPSYSQSADIRIGFGKLDTATTGTIGETSYGYTGTTLVHDVIVMLEDPSQSSVVSGSGGYVYQSYGTTLFQLALHEIGHSLGLDHNGDSGSVMYPTPGAGDTNLNATDIAGIQFLYGLPAPVPVPAPTPVPAPAPVPAPSTNGLVLKLSEDAYLGDAQFTVAVDGLQVGGAQSVTTLHSSGQSQTFNLGGTFAAGPHRVDVSFINDAWGGTAATDRNLYVDGVSINGVAASGGTGSLFSNGMLTGTVTLPTATTTPVPAPAPVPTPTPAPAPSTNGLVLKLSEDAYLGDAQFTVSVDGQQVGVAQSVTALHSLGQSQTFNLGGTFAAGPHRVDVSFINDAWGGTATTDRNLYVDGVSINGVAESGGTGSLFSNGTLTGTVTLPTATTTPVPAPTPAPKPMTSLVLNISEDAYLGDAQATVSLDGIQQGGIITVTSLHGSGNSQAMSFLVASDGARHVASVSFLNDAWGGTATTDRNLYVDSMVVGGQTVVGAVASLFTTTHADLAFTAPVTVLGSVAGPLTPDYGSAYQGITHV